MPDGQGPEYVPPPPIVPEPVMQVVDDAQIVHTDQPDVIKMKASDGVSYTLVLRPTRAAETPPKIDPTELVE